MERPLRCENSPNDQQNLVHVFAHQLHRERRHPRLDQADHRSAPEVEVIGAEAVNDAYERVLASDVRYRFVIDIDTLR